MKTNTKKQKPTQADNETWKAIQAVLLFYFLIPLLLGLFAFGLGMFIYIKTGFWIALISAIILIIFLIVFADDTGCFAPGTGGGAYEWSLLILFSIGLIGGILISLFVNI